MIFLFTFTFHVNSWWCDSFRYDLNDFVTSNFYCCNKFGFLEVHNISRRDFRIQLMRQSLHWTQSTYNKSKNLTGKTFEVFFYFLTHFFLAQSKHCENENVKKNLQWILSGIRAPNETTSNKNKQINIHFNQNVCYFFVSELLIPHNNNNRNIVSIVNAQSQHGKPMNR